MRRARLAAPLLAASAALLATSCGGSDRDDRAARALPPVRMTVTAPVDSATTREPTVTVRGSVSPPGSSVRVAGHAAEVVGATFTSDVDLDPGANVIDFAATAPGRGPALTAVRVTREMPVKVPDLSGLSPDDARAQVTGLGLRLDEQDAGGLLEDILPGKPGVCEQDPGAGKEVTRGATVRVLVAKRC
jgi:hypothetical protein